MLTLGLWLGAAAIGFILYYVLMIARPVKKSNKVSQWDMISYVDVHIPILPPGMWHFDTYTKDGSNWLTLNLRDENGNVLDSRTVNTTYRNDEEHSNRLWTDFPKSDFYEMLYLEIIEWALGYMPLRNKVA